MFQSRLDDRRSVGGSNSGPFDEMQTSPVSNENRVGVQVEALQ